MDLEQKERLQNKLIDTQRHLIDLEKKKKALTSSYGEQIKGARKRIDLIVETIDTGDFTILNDRFDDDEIQYFIRGKR